jgi:hypothetical protein
MTPEGKIKARINKLLDSYEGHMYRYMPVPSGYGKQSVDYLVCVDGLFVGIEAKKPGERPTARQDGVLEDIRAAGGSTFVVNDDASLEVLERFLHDVIKWGYPDGR